MRLFTSDLTLENWRQIIIHAAMRGWNNALRIREELRVEAMGERPKSKPMYLGAVGDRSWWLVPSQYHGFRVVGTDAVPTSARTI